MTWLPVAELAIVANVEEVEEREDTTSLFGYTLNRLYLFVLDMDAK